MAEITPGQGYPARGGGGSGKSSGAGGKVPNYRFHKSAHGAEDGTNTITISLGTVPNGKAWYIERMVVECNSSAASKFTLYDTDISKNNRRSFTPDGNDDEADINSHIYFPGGSEVIGVWTGADTGTVGYCIAQIREEG